MPGLRCDRRTLSRILANAITMLLACGSALDADAERLAGLRLVAEGRYAEAATVLEPLSRQADGEDLEIEIALAKARYHLSDYAAAEAVLRHVLEREPEHPEGLLLLGLVDLTRKNYRSASELLLKATDAGVHESWFYLGFAQWQLGSMTAASRSFSRYLAHAEEPKLKEMAEAFLGGRLQATSSVRGIDQALSEQSIFSRPFLLAGFRRDSEPLSAYRGRVIVLYFWASWCIPCRREIPALRDYYETTVAELADLELITVNLDYTAEDLEDFVDNEEPALPEDFRIYWDPNWKLLEHLGSTRSSLPQTYLIARDGTIRKIISGRADLDEVRTSIDELLSEAANE